MGRLEGKRALVTAAGSGIGRAVAESFLREGAEVFANDIDPEGVSRLAAAGIHAAVVDGSNARNVAVQAAAIGDIDAVVHCVGQVHEGTVLECDYDTWRNSFRINVDSFYHVVRAVLPGMLSRQNGSIVCISSVASSIRGLPNRAAYASTKAALIGLTKSVAADYVAAGIRCNAVCPGTVSSPSLHQRIARLSPKVGGAEQALAMYVDRQPMKRLGAPEEIAALCLFLASDESRFVTGQAMAVDGGMTI